MAAFPFKLIELTHVLSPEIPSWEGDCGFEHQQILDYSNCTTAVKFHVQAIHMQAGIGTHMDAPAHCIPGGKTIDEFVLDELLAPCILIDASSLAHERWLLSSEDIYQFERHYGKIAAGSFVIIHTGWNKYWHHPLHYRNNWHFPSISQNAALTLLERDIAGLGIDTLSPDIPTSGYPVHQIILGAGKYIVENIANAHILPPLGAYTLCLPIRTKGGTEAPIRLIGLIHHVE
ncbi:cyclase family protein [Legionella oakridgensis]|uniref:cyclase family protein n=1 Tax=Legionella oakridgensis TaxID=29423 RepID=UPI0003DE2F3C|nr:cyclase family protein [Legionella oakridgensis]ETO92404.1 kynurenine formamidase [Legionella oakridgensis RV-2-2007]